MTRAPFPFVSRLLALLALLALAWPGAMPVSATNPPGALAVMGEICGHAPATPDAPGDYPHCLSCVLAAGLPGAPGPVPARPLARVRRVSRRRAAPRLALVRPRPCPFACGPPRA
ncbi:hypothetical protein [Paracoccus sanguinis]|uniref:hypothetical protein n=1 Tax=Paracoccus sanguinis TaxID=1545044 RepID=UPI0014528EF5|nr:hypothetical protein [Paracoccus sanguinis]QJD16743.1 hypothetical protein HGN31_07575 [Paracoccus sanguinis]